MKAPKPSEIMTFTLSPFERLDVTRPLAAVCDVDEKELARAISNLINNAAEALEGIADGIVTLALRPSGAKDIGTIVSDNGKGIPDEVLAKLGKERASAGKEGSVSGSGIGVLHAARAIEAMGGKFQIQSRVGVRTNITILLPRVDVKNEV
jgi:signal transduction histidine kinase